MTSAASAIFAPGFASASEHVCDVHLYFRRGGPADGPPVLLWHGFLGTGHVWRKVAPALAEAGCSVLVPDMRGYGDSDKPEGTDGYDARSLAGDFRSLVRALEFGRGRPITLVAHDMGAPPALIYAADHPHEVASLHYLEEPVFLSDVLGKTIAYTPEATKMGGLWWWLMAFAPDLPETLIVGNERRFLEWFFKHYTADPAAIEPEAVDEYLRTFAGQQGVLGALGCYRAAFKTIDQTAPLAHAKIDVPVVALGGEKSQGGRVAEAMKMVAANASGSAVPSCGHFIPEEAPQVIVDHVLAQLCQAAR